MPSSPVQAALIPVEVRPADGDPFIVMHTPAEYEQLTAGVCPDLCRQATAPLDTDEDDDG